MQNFQNLLVWQKAHHLAMRTYEITNDFPRDEVFGLRNMMRKVSIDIPGAIAEGAAKPNDQEFAKYMSTALGFSNRPQYYALMARDLRFFRADLHDSYVGDLTEMKKMIAGFNRRLVQY